MRIVGSGNRARWSALAAALLLALAAVFAMPATTALACSPKISITKSADQTVLAGNVVTFTIVVKNTGDAAANVVTVYDTLDSNLSNAQYSLNGTTWSAWTGSLNLGTIAAGGSKTLKIKATVSPSDTCGSSLTNTAKVNWSGHSSYLTSTQTSTTVNCQSNVSIVKTADKAVLAGDTANFSITVSNAGPSDAHNVTVTDTLDSNLSNAQYSTDNGTTWSAWTGSLNLGTIAAGGSVTLKIKATVSDSNSSICNTSLENTASVVWGGHTDPVSYGPTSTVINCQPPSPPTAVKLSDWKASAGNGSVRLNWTTTFEQGTASFGIYRGTSSDRAAAKPIGGVVARNITLGASYSFTDGPLAAGTYYYWLKEVQTDGSQVWVTSLPARAQVEVGSSRTDPVPSAKNYVYIPFSRR